MDKSSMHTNPKTMLSRSSNMVESTFLCIETNDTNENILKHGSMESIILDLKKTIQDQENKIFRFEVLLRNHKVTAN